MKTATKRKSGKQTRKIVYTLTGVFLGCLFLFPIYILVLNSFKNTKGIFTDVIGFPDAATSVSYTHLTLPTNREV